LSERQRLSKRELGQCFGFGMKEVRAEVSIV